MVPHRNHLTDLRPWDLAPAPSPTPRYAHGKFMWTWCPSRRLLHFAAANRTVRASDNPPIHPVIWYRKRHTGVAMGMQTGQAKVPARISVQMSDELKSRLLELARREYGGDLQALLRETLHARVDRGPFADGPHA